MGGGILRLVRQTGRGRERSGHERAAREDAEDADEKQPREGEGEGEEDLRGGVEPDTPAHRTLRMSAPAHRRARAHARTRARAHAHAHRHTHISDTARTHQIQDRDRETHARDRDEENDVAEATDRGITRYDSAGADTTSASGPQCTVQTEPRQTSHHHCNAPRQIRWQTQRSQHHHQRSQHHPVPSTRRHRLTRSVSHAPDPATLSSRTHRSSTDTRDRAAYAAEVTSPESGSM
eukprot:1645515-Rhodomonas_salina.1